MRWVIATPLFMLGLLAELTVVGACLHFVVDCIRTRQYRMRSSLPIIGPLLITLGYWASPLAGHSWIAWLPWCLEALILVLSYFVLSLTGARRATA